MTKKSLVEPRRFNWDELKKATLEEREAWEVRFKQIYEYTGTRNGMIALMNEWQRYLKKREKENASSYRIRAPRASRD